jgi:hypothetical protein
MKAGAVALWAAAVGVALSGCGISSSSTTSGTTTAKAASVPPGTPASLSGVHGTVLRAGELPGLVPQGPPKVSTSAQSWVAEAPPAQRASEAASLRTLGFVAGLSQQLAPSKGGIASQGGVSVVEQFRSAQGASGAIAAQLKQALARGESAFAVAGIPGARGFGFSGSSTDANVAFAVGPYYYLVGFGSPGSGAGGPTRAQLTAAAQSLYRRASG